MGYSKIINAKEARASLKKMYTNELEKKLNEIDFAIKEAIKIKHNNIQILLNEYDEEFRDILCEILLKEFGYDYTLYPTGTLVVSW